MPNLPTISRLPAALSLAASAGLAAPASAQVEYEFFLVDAFNTSYSLRECYVTEINEQNTASGAATASSSVSGFLWTESGDKSAIPVSSPKGLNNAGVVVDNNFVFDTATSTSTTVPGVGSFTVPRLLDINDAGLVVGHAWAGGNCSQVTCYAPLLWDAAGGSRLLTGVPNARTLARVNNAGQVLGHIADILLDQPQAFVYDTATSTYTNLSDTLPNHWLLDHAITEAADLSNTGSVTGTAQFAAEPEQGFLWTPAAGFTFLPGLNTGEAMRVTPGGVNASNVIVGMAAIAPSSSPEFAYHAFVWDEARGMRDLNTLTTPAPGFILDRAYRINDHGWIVGHGHFGPGWGTARGFVLKPIPQACYPNCDNSTAAPTLNVADFTCFLQKFAAADPYANCDSSTTQPTLNVADFTCFLQQFAAGCP